jgi:YidC/Oxa1 family membrane protein insertase
MASIFSLYQSIGFSHGLAIIFLGLTISTFLIPFDYLLTLRRKKIQPLLSKLTPLKEEIERCYYGQTRFYYLNTLYKQHNYSIFDQFSSTFPLLIQVPLFILAYNFLKEQNFASISFFIIKDLSLPDSLFIYKGLRINIFPLLMTLINLLSIEMQLDVEESSKKFLRLIALLFLVVLYSMPSAMVLYWLTNNFFSFLRLFSSSKNRNKLFSNILFFLDLCRVNFKNYLITPFGFLYTLYTGIFCLLFFLASNFKNNGAWKTGLIVFIFSILQFLYLISKKKFNSSMKPNGSLFLLLNSVFFLLIPVWYYGNGNLDFFSLEYIFEIFIKLIIPSCALGFVISYLFSKYIQFEHGYLYFISLVFLFLWMPFFNFELNLVPTHNFPIPIFLAVFTFIFLNEINKRIGNKVLLVGSLISIFFGLYTISKIKQFNPNFSFAKTVNQEPKENFKTHLPNLKTKPDVYFLIYDSYMDSKYFNYLGINNINVLNFLKTNNFKIYDKKLSLENASLPSLGILYESFNANFKIEKKSKDILRDVLAGNNHLDQFLQSQGYITTTIASSYFTPRNGRTQKDVQISNRVGNVIFRGLLSGGMNSETVTEEDSDMNPWNLLKNKYFSPNQGNPRWIYMHQFLPGHSPSNSKCDREWFNKFKRKVDQSHKMIIDDVNLIIKNNPKAIIIIAGDHGPALDRCGVLSNNKSNDISGVHLIDHYGVHISIRWPKDNFEKYDNFAYLQGVFHSVLSYLTENENLVLKQPKGQVCLKNVCASHDSPITNGPDKGKMIYETI